MYLRILLAKKLVVDFYIPLLPFLLHTDLISYRDIDLHYQRHILVQTYIE
jgi:hypothetical protein